MALFLAGVNVYCLFIVWVYMSCLGYCLGGLNLPEISRNMCSCNFSCADPQKNNSGPTQSKPWCTSANIFAGFIQAIIEENPAPWQSSRPNPAFVLMHQCYHPAQLDHWAKQWWSALGRPTAWVVHCPFCLHFSMDTWLLDIYNPLFWTTYIFYLYE